jgi:hypothetical protein
MRLDATRIHRLVVVIKISKLPILLLFDKIRFPDYLNYKRTSIHYTRCHSNKLWLVEKRLIAQSACLHRPICYRHLLHQNQTLFPVSSYAHDIKNIEGNNSIRFISNDSDFPSYKTYITCNAMMT